jgi:hypothetical protein
MNSRLLFGTIGLARLRCFQFPEFELEKVAENVE